MGSVIMASGSSLPPQGRLGRLGCDSSLPLVMMMAYCAPLELSLWSPLPSRPDAKVLLGLLTSLYMCVYMCKRGSGVVVREGPS